MHSAHLHIAKIMCCACVHYANHLYNQTYDQIYGFEYGQNSVIACKYNGFSNFFFHDIIMYFPVSLYTPLSWQLRKNMIYHKLKDGSSSWTDLSQQRFCDDGTIFIFWCTTYSNLY